MIEVGASGAPTGYIRDQSTGGTTPISAATVATFVNTTNKFWNGRENKTVNVTQLDVQAYGTWVGTKKYNSVYINDTRNYATTPDYQPGVRLVNGAKLPVGGLTVASEEPVYIKGDYNIKDDTGTSSTMGDTVHTRPASVVADAVTILSNNWNDNFKDGTVLKNQKPTSTANYPGNKVAASSTTINAALISGIVETEVRDGGSKEGYSGGAENYPRLLEDWSGDTLTYNGSMVILFKSQIAKGKWAYYNSSGARKDYYGVPTRQWAFDMNFLDNNKLPPGTPQAKYLTRNQWTVLGANGQK